jgi:hypothetical protein
MCLIVRTAPDIPAEAPEPAAVIGGSAGGGAIAGWGKAKVSGWFSSGVGWEGYGVAGFGVIGFVFNG